MKEANGEFIEGFPEGLMFSRGPRSTTQRWAASAYCYRAALEGPTIAHLRRGDQRVRQ